MSDTLYDLNAAKPEPVSRKAMFGSDRQLLIGAFILGAVMVVWRFYAGVISHVIWEESHFVLSGAYFDWGYPDIPAGFPWLARAVTELFGWDIRPLRIVALLIAMAVPPAVYFMARPVTSHRNALFAAIIAMLMPPIAFNGTVFYPEGALQLSLALMLGCVLRAVQAPSNHYKWWALTGICAAVGLLIHFRFLVPGLAMFLFLLASPLGRAQWKKPGLYVAAVFAVLGLVPSLIYNMAHNWPAIEFHVLNRPRFDPKISRVFNFLITQMFSAGPVFFVAMVVGGWKALWKDRHSPVTLLAWQAMTIFAFYWFQGTINKKIMPHWPFMAFLPLLPVVPGMMIAFADAAREGVQRYWRVGLLATGPVLGVLTGAGATFYQWAYRHSAEIPYEWRAINILKNENYSVLEPDLAEAAARAKARFGGEPAWVTDEHVTAVRLEFPAPKDRRLYTLDSPDDVYLNRFVVARKDWGLDREELLKAQGGKGVVLVLTEPSYIYHEYVPDLPVKHLINGRAADTVGFYTDLCKTFDEVEPLKTVSLMPGRTRIQLYTARVRETPRADWSGPCALMPQVYIAQPAAGEIIETNNPKDRNFYGMVADPQGITKVEVFVDGKLFTQARIHIDVKESPAPPILKYDPQWPALHYDFRMPVDKLEKGVRTLQIKATRTDGSVIESEPRMIYVQCSQNLLAGCK